MTITLKVEGEEGDVKLELSDEHMDHKGYVEMIIDSPTVDNKRLIVDIQELSLAIAVFDRKRMGL